MDQDSKNFSSSYKERERRKAPLKGKGAPLKGKNTIHIHDKK